MLVPVVSSSTVTLLGGQYCSTDEGDGTHADPGDIISINCAVDNPDNLLNSLVWSISSFGVSVTNTNGNDDSDEDQPEFVSTVNSFDPTQRTTNATLTFPAVSDLDEAVVECRGVQASITSECTLFIESKCNYCHYAVICIFDEIVAINYNSQEQGIGREMYCYDCFVMKIMADFPYYGYL